MLEKCENCGRRALIPVRNEDGKTFCSQTCRDYYANPQFCDSCFAGTRPFAASWSRMNGCGMRLFGHSSECPKCHSIVQRMWFTFLWIPLLPGNKYRVKYARPGEFFSRLLSECEPASPERLMEQQSDEQNVLYGTVAAELFDQGRTRERKRQHREALAAYQEVAGRYPLTPAGRAAARCIERLRAEHSGLFK